METMTIKTARKLARSFMQKSGKLISWIDIRTAKNGTIVIGGIAYNIHGYKKIELN